MKSLIQQIANRCIHFTGIFQSKTCNAGVKYDDVKVLSSPIKLPCLSEGGECPKCQFLTPEQAKARVEEIEGDSVRTLHVYAKIKEHCHKTDQSSGTIKCGCPDSGDLVFNVSPVNRHISATCQKCKMGFIE